MMKLKITKIKEAKKEVSKEKEAFYTLSEHVYKKFLEKSIYLLLKNNIYPGKCISDLKPIFYPFTYFFQDIEKIESLISVNKNDNTWQFEFEYKDKIKANVKLYMPINKIVINCEKFNMQKIENLEEFIKFYSIYFYLFNQFVKVLKNPVVSIEFSTNLLDCTSNEHIEILIKSLENYNKKFNFHKIEKVIVNFKPSCYHLIKLLTAGKEQDYISSGSINS